MLKNVFAAMALVSLLTLPGVARDSAPQPEAGWWTVDAARAEAFKTVQYWIDPGQFPEQDPQFEENRQALNAGQTRLAGRELKPFEDGSYAVQVPGQPYIMYYLDDGLLFRVDSTQPRAGAFPQKVFSYAAIDVSARPNSYDLGELARVAIKVDPVKSFVFMPDGSLIARWEGDACFYADGKACDADEAPYLKP